MRQTIVKTGIQERLGYLLGTNDAPDNVGASEVTFWSAQASMIENIRRVVRGVVGGDYRGKIMNGLEISQVATTDTIAINSGIGFTPLGNIVIINGGLSISKTVSAGTHSVYLMHGQSTDGSLIYHWSNIMGTTTTPINIISDDICANTANPSIVEGQIQFDQTLSPTNDGIYLGTVTLSGSYPYFNMVVNSGAFVGTFLATLSGFNSTVSGTASYEINGNTCTIRFPAGLIGTSNIAFHSISGMPQILLPSTNQYSNMISVIKAGGNSNCYGYITIKSTLDPWDINPISQTFTSDLSEGLEFSTSITYYLK